jgi:DNA-binding beta-propeller fold protein YncE
MMRGNLLALLACLGLCLGFGGAGPAVGEQRASSGRPQPAPQAPTFQVDPLWPKPLPNHWILGSVTGVRVDAQDHIWLVHRGADSLNARQEMGLATNPPGSEYCCSPAPFVLEFDPAGNLVSHWGGPGEGYDWPRSPGGMAIDAAGNVWIAAAGATDTEGGGRGRGRAGQAPPPAAPRPQDAHVLKFSRAGKFLLQIGKPGKIEGSDSQTALNRPTAVDVDPAANEVYVADAGNRRVAVFDAATGAHKRHWGAYGERPGNAAAGPYDPKAEAEKQFRTLSCVKLAKDGMVYVCDRPNDRIQVFRKNGTFVKEAFVSKTTTGDGSVWDVAFSTDPQQRLMYVADGQDQKVFILQRDTLAVVSSFGAGGRYPGHFFGVGSIATDSRGDVYTGETYEGKRLQRFVAKGPGAAGGGGR